MHELHRRIDAPGGEAEIEIVFDPRFDYARETPRLVVGDDGVMAEGARGERFAVSVSRRMSFADGVAGDEGAFILCGFWLAEALALGGRLDEALETFGTHAQAANHLGLLADDVSLADGVLLGNFPQAFSHLGLIHAALRLDLAPRLRDEGSSRAPHLVGAFAHI